MKRVASLYLPDLSIDLLRRIDGARRSGTRPSARGLSLEPLEEAAEEVRDGARIADCSCPRGGGWRPGARWANREERQAQIDALPVHQRPPMRMLGRRTEAAQMPFRGLPSDPQPARRLQVQDQLGSPLVVTQRIGQRMVLVAVSLEAAALGLHPGMALTQARVIASDLDIRSVDPLAERAFLERLCLLAARRWTPAAAISGPDGLWLDLSGVAHLFGGERRMGDRILHFCERLGFTARIAVASTTGAAHALARFGAKRLTLCQPGEETAAIALLPPAALRLDDRALQATQRFGIATVGELMAMPRGPLGRRCGSLLLTRIDQATGRIGEPFDPIVPRDPPIASLHFVEPIASAEAIEQVIGDLVVKLTAMLEREGLGGRRLMLVCDRVDGERQKLTVGTSSATRDPAHLQYLLNTRIEQIEPGFGIEAMHLVAQRYEPLTAEQVGDAFDRPEPGLPPLVDRIASRIGSSRVFRLGAVESDIPERSVIRVAPLGQLDEWPREWPRPVRLLARPEPVDQVIAELPDQPPLRFVWRGKLHRVHKADGPERIHGEWWKRSGEDHAVRDYFQVEDDEGARFWLFRRGDGVDGRTGNLDWYVHGLFA